jgi:hypothetical protein
VAGQRVESVGVDDQRHVDAQHELARERLRLRRAAQPWAEHHRVGAADRRQRRRDRLRGERAILLGQPDHHRLEQSHGER